MASLPAVPTLKLEAVEQGSVYLCEEATLQSFKLRDRKIGKYVGESDVTRGAKNSGPI
jgi:hypothetical protein